MARGAPSWGSVRRRVQKLDRAELMELLRALYVFSPGNRRLVEQWLAGEHRGGAAFEAVRGLIREQFHLRQGEPGLDLGMARRVIRRYEMATGDVRGALELMVYLVETGTRFTNKYGDIDGEFYDHLLSVFEEVVRRLSGPPGSKWRREFRPRLAKVVKAADGIGWGYGDGVSDVFGGLSKK